mmetsp:Transcript_19621/g.52292  ORF Transcript_19621/g.52292 Transcript_19621/m.52292 type:complete len:225 (+) Transcript_19621:3236-3910(+)
MIHLLNVAKKIANRHRGAERQASVIETKRIEIWDGTEVNQCCIFTARVRRQILHHSGACGPANQVNLLVPRLCIRARGTQLVHVKWTEILFTSQCIEKVERLRFVAEHVHWVRNALMVHTTFSSLGEVPKCVENWAVASATAQIPIKISLYLFFRRRRVILQESVHIHHPTRRAETTLRPILRNCILERMHTVLNTAQTLRGHDVATVDSAQSTETTVDGHRLS